MQSTHYFRAVLLWSMSTFEVGQKPLPAARRVCESDGTGTQNKREKFPLKISLVILSKRQKLSPDSGLQGRT